MAIQLDQYKRVEKTSTPAPTRARAGSLRAERQASRERLLRTARQTLVQMRALGVRSTQLRGRDAGLR